MRHFDYVAAEGAVDEFSPSLRVTYTRTYTRRSVLTPTRYTQNHLSQEQRLREIALAYNEITEGKFPVPIGRHTTQAPYRPDELEAIVSGLRRLYPTFRRVLVGCDGSSRTQASASPALERAAAELGFNGVQCSSERDEDLLFMSTRCNVLVVGRSTFSLVAMLFAGGDSAMAQRILYAPRTFVMSAMVGLFTPLDHSGVRQVEELMRNRTTVRTTEVVPGRQDVEEQRWSRTMEHAHHSSRNEQGVERSDTVFGPFTDEAP